MPMTGLEQSLLGVVLLFVGGAGTKVIWPGVSKATCSNAHEQIEREREQDKVDIKELFDAKLDPLRDQLRSIESKIDERNKAK